MGYDRKSALMKIAYGKGVLGSPSVEGLPEPIKPLVGSVTESTKGMKTVEGVNPDETDLGIMRDIVKSPEFVKMFEPKWYQLPWTPAQEAFKGVHPQFAEELTTWKNLLKMKGLQKDVESGKVEFGPKEIDATLSWIEKNRPQRDLLYSAVTNRNEQLARSGTVPSWSARRSMAGRGSGIAAKK